MAKTLLRRRNGRRAEVTSVELFFDLVFVIAVTQISHALLEHMSWRGALEAALLLAAIWWAWIDTAWITNWLDPARLPVRLMLFVLMAIGLVITSSLPEAFGERGCCSVRTGTRAAWSARTLTSRARRRPRPSFARPRIPPNRRTAPRASSLRS